jgi:hypothetical protein
MLPVEEYSDQELREMAGGCTEVTCPRHGRFNWELVERGVTRG